LKIIADGLESTRRSLVKVIDEARCKKNRQGKVEFGTAGQLKSLAVADEQVVTGSAKATSAGGASSSKTLKTLKSGDIAKLFKRPSAGSGGAGVDTISPHPPAKSSTCGDDASVHTMSTATRQALFTRRC
jgi:phage-related tail fiber protein